MEFVSRISRLHAKSLTVVRGLVWSYENVLLRSYHALHHSGLNRQLLDDFISGGEYISRNNGNPLGEKWSSLGLLFRGPTKPNAQTRRLQFTMLVAFDAS